ncbi:hypothetical protein [Telluribacter sp.]|jgi:hypothetical protein|uniref:hypothetical protein n=1 Tax=Telluribacter sp. TaxID=1978767 RepID=UPI002E12BA2D|nr:hypothetical protein [Telluribacter sp.]
MLRYTYLFLLLLLTQSCNLDERVGNTKELSAEIKNSKIKRITDVQLISTMDTWGKRIVSISQKTLTEALTKNPEKATALCGNMQQLPVLDALKKEYGVQVELLGPSNIQNPAFTAKERELLDAYLYNAEKGLPQSDNIQRLNDTLFVYNAPVPADNVISKTCYTQQEVPFAVWRILFNKKDVIRKIDVKKLD